MAATEKLLTLPVQSLHPNPYNRGLDAGLKPGQRRGFDAKSLKELAESIQTSGVVVPLIVRPREGKSGYEIIAGERRWTAAALVDKKLELPCRVMDLDDRAAREINLLENLQRVDLHPIEEARNYAQLLDLTPGDRGANTKALAERLGKSLAFLYGRLKLLALPPVAITASLSGKLNASTALLIARIPDPALAARATLEILAPFTREEKEALDPAVEPLSFRAAKDHIQQKYMVRLKGAPFDPENADLVPTRYRIRTDFEGGTDFEVTSAVEPTVPASRQAYCSSEVGNSRYHVWEGKVASDTRSKELLGPTDKKTAEQFTALIQSQCRLEITRVGGGPCSSCPLRTGNLKALFPDVESADVCTSPGCFKAKTEADFKRRAALAKEENRVLLKDKAAAQLFYQGELRSGDYVDLQATFPGEKKKTWEQVLGDALTVPVTQARDDQGKTRLLVSVADALQAAQAAHVKLPKSFEPPADPQEAEAKRQAVEAERAERHAQALQRADTALADLRTAVTKTKPDKKFWRFLAEFGIANSSYADRHGLDSDKKLAAHLKPRSEAELRAILVECLFVERPVTWQSEFEDTFTAALDHFGVKVKLQPRKKAE